LKLLAGELVPLLFVKMPMSRK